MDITKSALKVDLTTACPEQLASSDLADVSKVVVSFPLSTFGSTNSLLDIAADLLLASWILERLAAKAGRITTKVAEDYYRPLVTATLHQPSAEIAAVLADCALFVGHEEELDASAEMRVSELQGELVDYADELYAIDLKAPEMAEWYFVNHVASYGELSSEAPDYLAELIQRFPERRVGFHRSAWSGRLGAGCYASHDAWVLPADLDLDHFFRTTGQKYRRKSFAEGKLNTLDGRSFVTAGQVCAAFPARRYFASQVCAAFSMADQEDSWSEGPFGWGTTAQYVRPSPDGFIWSHPERYLVDATGTMVVVIDGKFQHVFTEVLPLPQHSVKALLADAGRLSETLAAGAGISATGKFDWGCIDDDSFENLCFDIIYAHPKFDSDTIRRFGKARSRDGGRDIQVSEGAVRFGERPRKWIFQCKLVTSGSSLGRGRVQDVGDMLTQYSAGGFGIMTNVPIDATLYDKLDAVCNSRGVEQINWSRLEIERTLVANPALRKKFFPD